MRVVTNDRCEAENIKSDKVENVESKLEKLDQDEETLCKSKWIDTNKAFEGEPTQIRSRIVARTIDQMCMLGLLHWKR